MERMDLEPPSLYHSLNKIMPNAAPTSALIIDDEESVHITVRSALDICRINVLGEFYDPVSAIEHLESDEPLPDIILLDVNFETSALSGIDALEIIRESYPLIPVILLTGMSGDTIEPAHEHDLVYYISKPINPEQLCNSIRYYYKSSIKYIDKLKSVEEEILAYEEVLAAVDASAPASGHEEENSNQKEKIGEKISDLLSTLISNYQITESFQKDMLETIASDFNSAKRVANTLISLDRASTPSQNIHKVKGTEDIYSVRVNHKIRLFYFDHNGSRKLLRIDRHHDTKGMDRWIKNNYDSFC